MPQQIDPNTGMPIGHGYGDLEGGGPSALGTPVRDGYTLKPFEYFANEGGQRYVRSALGNPSAPSSSSPPPPVLDAPSGIGQPSQVPQGMIARPEPGIGQMQGQPDMMASILPLLMMLMQPGVGGFSGGSYGGIGVHPGGPPAPYSPQPTGGISRGSFQF